MNIREKLKLLKKIENNINKKYKEKRKKKKGIHLPNFEVESTPLGEVYIRYNFYPLGTRHGSIYLRDILDIPNNALSFLGENKSFEEISTDKLLFIDTETTGLAGGVGTVAFLVGVGHFCKNAFLIKQYFMPDYPFERSMLWHINELMKNMDAIITFNGASFDIPLIKSRMIMNHILPSKSDPLHLDLLISARRLWKNTLTSCRLTHLEENILGFSRIDDIPSSLIPHLYFQYLRNRNFHTLEKVFEHNLYDILSMTSLLHRISYKVLEKESLQKGEYLGIGKWHEKKGNLQKAMHFYQRALKEPLSNDLRKMVLYRLSFIYKKFNMWENAINTWEEIARRYKFETVPLIEIAKYFEHKVKNYEKALTYTKEAKRRVIVKHRLKSVSIKGELEEIEHRRRRLQRKIEKSKE